MGSDRAGHRGTGLVDGNAVGLLSLRLPHRGGVEAVEGGWGIDTVGMAGSGMCGSGAAGVGDELCGLGG